MKKFFHSLIAVLVTLPALYSCAEKELLEPAVQTDPAEVPSYSYRFEIADDETRAIFNDEGVFWESGDQVGLFLGSGSSIVADVNTEVSPKTIEFSTSAPLTSETLVHAYYPFREDNASVSASKVVFPRNQQGGSVSAMPMAGVPTMFQEGESNGVIRFQNLGSIIDFRVYSALHTAERIQSIRLSVTGSNPISGEATLDLTGVTRGDDASMALTWTEGAPEVSSVTLLQTATIAASKDLATEPLYLVVAPGTYSGSIVVVTDAASYTFSLPSMAFDRNVLRRFNLNLDGSKVVRTTLEEWYEKITSADQLTGGDEYLIVYESDSKVFKPILSGTNTLDNTGNNVFGVTIENGRIRATADVDHCRVLFETAQSGKYYMKAVESGYYFYPTNNTISATDNQQNATSVTVSFVSGTNGNVNIKAGSYYFKYSTYSSCFKQSSTSTSSEPALYKRVDNGGLKRQYLQFTPPFVRISLDGHTTPFILADTPVLSGLKTQIALWQSSDPDVAVVDASGMVQVKGEGVTVITAVAEPNDIYAGGSASYNLIVLGNGVFSLENDKLETYLDLVDAQPYNPPADYSFTHMTSDLYSGNTSQTNRLDWPKPVSVSWTNPANGNATKVVYVYNDADMDGVVNESDFELSVPLTNSSSTTAEIYNLIPNRAYYYEVINGNDTEPIASGSFRTAGRRRMIKVGDSPYGKGYANNCRDFGGQVTADGTKMIKYGKMFRGSNMDLTSSEAQKVLKEYLKIGLDVDLRRDRHVESWDGYQGDGNNIINDALNLGSDWHTTQPFSSWDDLSSPTKMNEILTKVFAAVASNRGVYIHCMVGADRTGYVCMLIEAILGISQGGCDVDYELTSFSGAVDSGKPRLRTGVNNHYYRTKTSNGVTTVQGVDFINTLPGNTFQEKAIYWVVNNTSLTQEDITAFQNNMLENLN